MVSGSVHNTGDSSIDIVYRDLMKQSISSYRYTAESFVEPIGVPHQLVVVLDPSKTRTGVVIGDMSGKVYLIVEISGAGSARATHVVCELMKKYLAELLHGAKVAFFSQEKVILPKEGYKSMVILNEIRTNLNAFCREELGLEPIEVNNFIWKSAILPEGYRQRDSSGKKGSYRWLIERFPHWSGIPDDVTDAICIYLYILYAYAHKVPVYCDVIEEGPAGETILVEEEAVDKGMVEMFRFNPAFSIQDNANYFMNRRATTGCCLLPGSKVTIAELYKHHCMLTIYSDPGRVFMLVRRH